MTIGSPFVDYCGRREKPRYPPCAVVWRSAFFHRPDSESKPEGRCPSCDDQCDGILPYSVRRQATSRNRPDEGYFKGSEHSLYRSVIDQRTRLRTPAGTRFD